MASRKVAYPPKEEQEAIKGKIDEWLAALDELAREAEEGIALLHERRAALISAAVTGKIDVRGVCAPLTTGVV
jgi:type I restriction enzyme S subunit